jgi:hypothetical protein
LKKLLLFLVVVSFFGCKKKQQILENFDFGSTENAVYSNHYFKMHVPFDDSWYVKSQEEMKEIAKVGKELIESDSYKRALEASEINNAYLFTLFKYGPDDLFAYNPSLSIVAENTKMYPHVKRGRTYLQEVQKALSLTTVSYEFDMIDEEFIIGKYSFDMMNVTLDYLGLDIKQQYYTTISKGFSLSIILSYTTETQKAKLESMLNTIVFSEGLSKTKNYTIL